MKYTTTKVLHKIFIVIGRIWTIISFALLLWLVASWLDISWNNLRGGVYQDWNLFKFLIPQLF